MIPALLARFAPLGIKLAENAPAIAGTVLSVIGSAIGSQFGAGEPPNQAKIDELNQIVEREAMKLAVAHNIGMEAARNQVHNQMADLFAAASGKDPSAVKQAIGTIAGLAAGAYAGGKIGGKIQAKYAKPAAVAPPAPAPANDVPPAPAPANDVPPAAVAPPAPVNVVPSQTDEQKRLLYLLGYEYGSSKFQA